MADDESDTTTWPVHVPKWILVSDVVWPGVLLGLAGIFTVVALLTACSPLCFVAVLLAVSGASHFLSAQMWRRYAREGCVRASECGVELWLCPRGRRVYVPWGDMRGVSSTGTGVLSRCYQRSWSSTR